MSLDICEKFYSLQGEGPLLGKPTVFIRVGGCCMMCPYCDSKYASRDGYKPRFTLENYKDVDAFVKLVTTCPKDETPCDHYSITGGEPLLEKSLPLFVHMSDEILRKGYNLLVETTGITKLSDLYETNFYKLVIDEFYKNLIHRPTLCSSFASKSITYSCCPKLDTFCYPIDISIDQIINYYTVPSSFSTSPNFYFKLVYYKEIEDNILKFIDSQNINTINKTYIMPFTPIDNFNAETYMESCLSTIDFCKKHNLNFSPREHINMWGLKAVV